MDSNDDKDTRPTEPEHYDQVRIGLSDLAVDPRILRQMAQDQERVSYLEGFIDALQYALFAACVTFIVWDLGRRLL